ncbi:MAG: hypothetical protein HY675_03695, partial [Chloroflexi bacterium]|nr:hypothetical protein [Chloroflexota bacterium]
LSPTLIVAAMVALAIAMRKLPLTRSKRRLLMMTVLSLGVLVFLMLLSYLGLGPRQLFLSLPHRWHGFLGVLIAIQGALVAQSIARKAYARLVLAVVVFVVAADAIFVASTGMPPLTNEPRRSLVAETLATGVRATYQDRVATISGVVPDISYNYFGKTRLVGNYFGQGAMDFLYPAFMWLLLDRGEGSMLETRDPTLALAYMKSLGTTLLVIGDQEPAAAALMPGGRLGAAMPFKLRANGYAVFEAPGRKAQAILTSASIAKELVFPDLRYATEQENRLRDQLVLRFASVIDDPQTVVPEVSYPSQTEIWIAARKIEKGSYLIAFAPYDGGWVARVNGVSRNVERAGPHYVGLDLSTVEGDVEISLRHGVHWTWTVGIVLTLMSVVVLGLLVFSPKGSGDRLLRSIRRKKTS